MTNILENQLFKQNNVGLSHLTSPMNYTANQDIQNLALKRKEFLLKNIDDYEAKLNPKKSSTRPQTPKNEEEREELENSLPKIKPT